MASSYVSIFLRLLIGGGFLLVLAAVVVTVVLLTRRSHRTAPIPVSTYRVIVKTKLTDNGPEGVPVYRVAFDLDGGARLELPVPGVEYTRLREGDRGCLVCQGTRFLSFTRDM